MNWFKDLFFGKLDNSAIYKELPEMRRRNPASRSAHFLQKRKEYEEKFDTYLKISNEKNLHADNVNKYKFMVLKNLYSHNETALREYTQSVEGMVIDACFRWMNSGNDVKNQTWRDVLKELEKDEVVKTLLPIIFTEEFASAWEVVKVKKINLEKEKEEKRYKIKHVISELERDHSRKMSLFMSMSPGMSRTELSISIDNTEQHIAIYKEELRKLG
ncbi:hypothetical protein HEP89_29530 (plasmid) [Labrenzia sp. 5N]|uniref:hypothetical protein n=1 Tax=Labrenzia sp. 5N TaxID=2723402 RepID=UPI001446A469|nr:hypothetical protein [Labrenzia sp. 5N]NKX68281.1 hypothetical protein [Labrenzia sp. 5N]